MLRHCIQSKGTTASLALSNDYLKDELPLKHQAQEVIAKTLVTNNQLKSIV